MADIVGQLVSPVIVDPTNSSKTLFFDSGTATTGTTQTLTFLSTANRTLTFPASGLASILTTTGTFTSVLSKTITDSSNTVYVNGLFSNSGANTVTVSGAAAPTTGQALTASNSTTAAWTTVATNNVMTTRGDMEYRNNSNVTARLPIGTSDQYLRVQSGNIAWTNFIVPIGEAYFYEDFRGNFNVSENRFNTVAGGGASVVTTGTATGIYNGVNTISCTTTGGLILITGQTSVTGGIPLGAGMLTLELSVYIPILSTAADRCTVRCGLVKTTGTTADPSDGIYFELDSSVDTTWICKTAQSSSRTPVGSGIVATAATWYRLGFILNANATSVIFYINGLAVANITTTIPSSRSCVPGIQFSKLVNTNSITNTCLIDYLTYNIQFTGGSRY